MYAFLVLLGLLCATGCNSAAVEQKAEKVQAFFLYEVLCGGCHDWILNQLAHSKDILPIVDLDMVPYGHASGSNGDYHCGHGPVECEGNKYHACIWKYVTDRAQAVDYLACTEGDMENYMEIAESCATKLGIDWSMMHTCYTDEGNDLFEEQGRKTH